ncbi:hypothetical protein RJT34_24935 [Clitoria ternatea]|uniref:Uncharacterized protein n=1 Tax=Clitoria ternatea TaxID=43366 RepID=A0AAN9FRL1_CLITE
MEASSPLLPLCCLQGLHDVGVWLCGDEVKDNEVEVIKYDNVNEVMIIVGQSKMEGLGRFARGCQDKFEIVHGETATKDVEPPKEKKGKVAKGKKTITVKDDKKDTKVKRKPQ